MLDALGAVLRDVFAVFGLICFAGFAVVVISRIAGTFCRLMEWVDDNHV